MQREWFDGVIHMLADLSDVAAAQFVVAVGRRRRGDGYDVDDDDAHQLVLMVFASLRKPRLHYKCIHIL